MASRMSLFMMLIMTVLMGLVLSAVFTVQAVGLRQDFLAHWLGRFASTYVIVLPTVLVVAPIAQWAARRLDAMLAGAPDGIAPASIAPAGIAPDQAPASPRDIALAAWRANAAGHAGKDFSPWLDALADDVRITMPLGPFRGETVGKTGAAAIYAAIAGAQPRLTYEAPLRVTESGDTVVIEFDDHGVIAGMPYRNRIAGSFDIRDGKVAAYREYFGDIDPAVVALMNGAARP